jgi:hypothetical protein
MLAGGVASCIMEANTLRLGKHTFPIVFATFCRVSQPGDERPAWEFEIRTGPPLGVTPESDEFYLYAQGVRLYSESDPVPLPDTEDLTGVELHLPSAFDPTTILTSRCTWASTRMSARCGCVSSNAVATGIASI